MVYQSHYEPHYYSDAKFPILFHRNVRYRTTPFVPHWHQNPEILYFQEGTATVSINTHEVSAEPGIVIVVPGNALHSIVCTSERTIYYCLIPDCTFCENCGLPLSELFFEPQIRDEGLNVQMDGIIEEFCAAKSNHKPQILAQVLSLLVYLSRYHLSAPMLPLSKSQASQLEMIKKVFSYIDKNYASDLTIDFLADYVGFSRYYFCHTFKALTRMTVVSYINYIRCKKAKEYLARTGCSVSEAAAKCGFSNLSYFTRTYRKYVGSLPSQDMAAK